MSVIRNFDTPDEEHALATAETIDYASIASSFWTFERFDKPNDPETYRHRETYFSYTWNNVIGTEVIDYYQNRYDYQRKQIIRPIGVHFLYNANVTYFEQLHIFNSTRLEYGSKVVSYDTYPLQFENITGNIAIIAFCGSNDSTPLTTIRPFEYMLCRNQSEYSTLTSNI
ncbi:MAG: hypothetical protein LBE70_04375 [Nitrososphaerota archaeon]|nr:hypothetical protein [Nitrososphaerota archaeon]